MTYISSGQSLPRRYWKMPKFSDKYLELILYYNGMEEWYGIDDNNE